ncbi:protoporphyrinogen oxidase [Ornithinimicrobium cryptoxanthini]|uniref:Coproporphyrinogen III oxidase n=1 Tax=Ornithinimicrobium cryptoxanthini TaxID=2934161 RepID=A0ABY4YLZ6_9MICO|nr:protoporphyrinogen oxidase [Ornithinimicrobium cryptoxanthini]USQ77699.1 protoporphyrinogen oxidase [Ornithinimicrobium cryptoxanthini]
MRYLVVGGGISGLAAAWELVQHVDGRDVTLLDAGDRPGGKLRGATVGGVHVDVGAESVLARRPEALDLIHEAGLGDELVHPTGARAAIWSRGRLHPVPRRTLLGVPADPDDLAGLLTDEEVSRIRAEVPETLAAADISVGDLVARRLGDAVSDRLVEPLLGGVYAGHARLISAAAAAPALLAAARAGESLVAAAGRAVPVPADPTAPRPPVFAGIEGGLHRLPAALLERLTERGVTVRSGTIARELRRTATGWQVVTGPVPDPRVHDADRVILAVPPAPTARLLREAAPVAADALSGVETASMAVLTFAFSADQPPDLTGSGFLVPPRDGRFLKAATFSMNKWDWVRAHGVDAGPDGQDVLLLRASVGRHQEEASLQHLDRVLVELALTDLGDATGSTLPAPLDAHVQRWGGGLPQAAVGHRDRVAAVLDSVARQPGLAVAGAAYDGVGVPACIASGRAAAVQVLAG